MAGGFEQNARIEGVVLEAITCFSLIFTNDDVNLHKLFKSLPWVRSQKDTNGHPFKIVIFLM